MLVLSFFLPYCKTPKNDFGSSVLSVKTDFRQKNVAIKSTPDCNTVFLLSLGFLFCISPNFSVVVV